MKFAICNEQFEGWEFERVCRYVNETKAVQVPKTVGKWVGKAKQALGNDKR